MWVKQLSLRNFRGFESLALSLDRPVTVLVGANGSGKTSVLRAIAAAIGWIQSGDEQRQPSRAPAFVRSADVRSSSETAEIRIDFRHVDVSATVKLSCHRGERWKLGARDESTLFDRAEKPVVVWASTDRLAKLDADRGGLIDNAMLRLERKSSDSDRGVLALVSGSSYRQFVEWFKEREDIENARRVAARDFAVQDRSWPRCVARSRRWCRR
jgi:predicted ATP-binding protein involved in virulence